MCARWTIRSHISVSSYNYIILYMYIAGNVCMVQFLHISQECSVCENKNYNLKVYVNLDLTTQGEY